MRPSRGATLTRWLADIEMVEFALWRVRPDGAASARTIKPSKASRLAAAEIATRVGELVDRATDGEVGVRTARSKR
ncbi:MAG: hypothetical protein R6T93_02945, partial [Trueperaceae bacterium]